MEQAQSQIQNPAGRTDSRPVVFLDTNVIAGYLRGDSISTQLFSAEADGRIRLAVNPIIIQEILLTLDAATLPRLERIQDRLSILPLDLKKAEALVPRVKSLHGHHMHSNDILIISSAADCDFLVTRDKLLMDTVAAMKLHVNVITPEALASGLQAA